MGNRQPGHGREDRDVIHRIFIPNWRPVLDNVLTRGNRFGVNKLKQADRKMIAAYAAADGTPKATGKRLVTLEITLTGRQQEADPMAYCKSLLDGLVKCGLLIDDTAEFCEWEPPTYQRAERGEEASTTIVLTPIA